MKYSEINNDLIIRDYQDEDYNEIAEIMVSDWYRESGKRRYQETIKRTLAMEENSCNRIKTYR